MKTAKIKLADIENVLRAMNILTSKELPIRTSYNISKITRVISNEYELFAEKRKQIAEKYAIRDKEGNPLVEGTAIKINPSKIEEAQKELNELLEIEFEVNFKPIKLVELETVSAKPSDLFNLERFIVDDDAL